MLKKLLIVVAVLLTLLGLYAAAGFYLVPKLAKKHLPQILSDLTGHTVQLQGARFDPFEWKADLQGVSLLLAEGKPLVSFEELIADVDVMDSVKQRALIVRSARLRQPVINVERDAEGRFNFDAVIEQITRSDTPEQESEQPETSGMPLILVRDIAIEQGQVSWSDFPAGHKQSETLQGLDFAMQDFSTAPNSTANFTLNVKLASGGGLDWQGDFNLSGLNSKGHLKLDNVALRKVWTLFLQELMPLEISDGYASLSAEYQFDLGNESGLQLQVEGGDVDIRQFALIEQAKPDPLIRIPFFDASGIRLDLQKKRVDIDEVSSSNADIKVWLQKDGQVNYQSLVASSAESGVDEISEEPSMEQGEASQAWRISLDELDLDNYRVAFTDYSQAKPVEMLFDQLNLALYDFRNTDNLKLPVEFDSRVNNIGRIKLEGDLGITPFSAELAVALQEIKLKAFQTYVDPFVSLELADGDLSTQGQLQLTMADDLKVAYQGDANINSLITRDKVKNLDFVKWDNMELKQMVLDVSKQDFKLGSVIFDRPYVRFTIKKDGSNNVNDILAVTSAAKPKAKVSKSNQSAATTQSVVSIGKIELKQGQSDFADYSLILPFVVRMNHLNGEVNGFTSNTDAAAKLKLEGKVRDLATVNIGGAYQFQSGDSDIALSFKHLPLPLVTPYMAEFAGYKIEKGQMALDLKYSIKQGALLAENKIFIDQLTLGEEVENPNAVSLPLELGIALLKDEDGKINLDFPITGSLEDPEFSVGSLVADVLVNLITKVASAPFDAIASLFDGDEDLSTVVFDAGGSELSDKETAKLDQVANALNTKPELVLEIKGIAYEILDWPVMRADVLIEILKKMKSGELRDQGKKIRSEYIELSEDEYKRLLAKFYAEVFPQKIDHTLFGAPFIKDNPEVEFYSVARAQLEAIMKPEPERLDELAVSRANRIAKYLIEQGGVDRSRLYILATELNNTDAEGDINVQLSLNVAS